MKFSHKLALAMLALLAVVYRRRLRPLLKFLH